MSHKEAVIEIVRKMPEEVTLEEILEEIQILAAIQRGEEAVREGRIISHQDVKRNIIRAQVERGRYRSEDEVIEEALRLLMQRIQDPQQTANRPLTEEEFQQLLIEKGLMSHGPAPRDQPRPRRDFQPITIEGEPLSETIIRERR